MDASEVRSLSDAAIARAKQLTARSYLGMNRRATLLDALYQVCCIAETYDGAPSQRAAVRYAAKAALDCLQQRQEVGNTKDVVPEVERTLRQLTAL